GLFCAGPDGRSRIRSPELEQLELPEQLDLNRLCLFVPDDDRLSFVVVAGGDHTHVASPFLSGRGSGVVGLPGGLWSPNVSRSVVPGYSVRKRALACSS